MKTRTRTLAIAACASAAWIGFAGCKQNPFPEEKVLSLEAPPEKEEVALPYSLSVPDVMEFREGELGEYQVDAWAAASAGRRVVWKGLPPGVVWDEERSVLTWIPGFNDGDPIGGKGQHRTYEVEALMVDLSNPKIAIRDTGTLVVNNVPRWVGLTVGTSYTVNEGEKLSFDMKVDCPDAPTGPFSVHATGLPSGAVIEPTSDPTKFTLKYAPNHEVFKAGMSNNGWSYYIDFPLSVTAFAPNGTQVSVATRVSVYDKRLKPVINKPLSVKQWPDVRFGIAAQDPNMEAAPVISLVGQPAFGKAEVVLGKSPSFVTLAEVRWSEIPPDMAGKKGSLTLKICVNAADGVVDNCSEEKVDVAFDAPLAFPPVIERAQWPFGTTFYVKESESKTITLPVKPYSFGEPDPKVKIEPASMNSEVTWKNGVLTIDAKKAGVKQVQVVAQAANGLATAESFVFEVLPKAWSPALVLADSLRDPDVQATVKWLSQPAVLNPSLMALDDRILSNRKVLVVGSSLLEDPSLTEAVTRAAKRIPNVLITTPLVRSLKKAEPGASPGIAEELDKLGVGVDEGLGEVNWAPELKRILMITQLASGFPASHYPVGLKGTLTAHSKMPMILKKLGTTTDCETVMTYYTKAEDDTVIFEKPSVIHCPRKTQGKIMVLGFELGDLVFDPRDEAIEAQWMKKWLEAQ